MDSTPINDLIQRPNSVQSREEPKEMIGPQSYQDILNTMDAKNNPSMNETMPCAMVDQSPMQQQSMQQSQPMQQQNYNMMQQQQMMQQRMMQQQMQQQGMQQHGMQQHYNRPVNQPIPMASKSNVNEMENLFDKNMQNDLMILFIVYLLVHTNQFQNIIKTKVPGMYNTTEQITIVGTLTNGFVLIALWIVVKRLTRKYFKEN